MPGNVRFGSRAPNRTYPPHQASIARHAVAGLTIGGQSSTLTGFVTPSLIVYS